MVTLCLSPSKRSVNDEALAPSGEESYDSVTMIGVFDSGIGGLTLVAELIRVLPNYPIIYFGDTARAPYGNKSPETIIRYAKEDAAFLLSKGATVIVIGCNTASAEATDALRAAHPNVPIFDVITPAVAATTGEKVGVIGTRATIASGVYQRLLRDRVVVTAPCPLFVPLVEEGYVNRPETKMIARRYLAPLKERDIDSLILGCTHYPLLKGIISAKMGKRVKLIDPAFETARHIAATVTSLPVKPDGGLRHVYVSDLTPHVATAARHLLGHDITLERVAIPTL